MTSNPFRNVVSIKSIWVAFIFIQELNAGLGVEPKIVLDRCTIMLNQM